MGFLKGEGLNSLRMGFFFFFRGFLMMLDGFLRYFLGNPEGSRKDL